MTTLILEVAGADSNTPDSMTLLPQAVVASPTPTRQPVGVPAVIPEGQSYYWTRKWQDAEEEARRDLESGRFRTFDDPDDAIRWLLSPEE